MAIVYDETPAGAVCSREAAAAAPGQPVLIDHFLEDAFEVDVDALGDGERVVIGGIMQHIEEAGVHSRRQRLRAAALQDQPLPPEHHAATTPSGSAWRWACAG